MEHSRAFYATTVLLAAFILGYALIWLYLVESVVPRPQRYDWIFLTHLIDPTLACVIGYGSLLIFGVGGIARLLEIRKPLGREHEVAAS